MRRLLRIFSPFPFLNKQISRIFFYYQYYSILLALHSGMRLGENRALNIDDISINEGIATINIKHGLDERNHLKCTKGKEIREVIINTTLAQDLITLGSLNPLKTGVVFWSNRQNKKTSGFITTKYIENGFYMALKEMGIDEKTYKQSGIISNSLLFFRTIQKREFEVFKESYIHLSGNDVLNELLSQIYINSTIAEKKFENYNKGLKYLIIGLCLFLFAIIVGLIFNMLYF